MVIMFCCCLFFKQKTAYEMRISDWSSDVCFSDLLTVGIEESDAFIAALLAHKLIESFDISLRFDDGETLRLEGLYSIGLDALHDLDDAAVLDLFRLGHLQLAYKIGRAHV